MEGADERREYGGQVLGSVLFIIIGVFSVFTGLILNVVGRGKENFV